MASNKNKKTAPSAAAQAAQEKKPENKGVSVIQLSDLEKFAELTKTGGMDHNHIMDMIRVQHETFRMDPKAAEHTGMNLNAHSPRGFQRIPQAE